MNPDSNPFLGSFEFGVELRDLNIVRNLLVILWVNKSVNEWVEKLEPWMVIELDCG
jgi:hypothetical protein